MLFKDAVSPLLLVFFHHQRLRNDGREKTVSERLKDNGRGIDQVLEALQAKRSKWFPFAGCAVYIESSEGVSMYVLEDSWGVFSLDKQ